ncbi:hypothetical protein [Luteibacter aegosomatissinici]|uniref:hypothetical protein n=1 Tax=Luteibacter aegosomatissinici TaxID=2911539 RepID=UPI001FF7CA9B|nr:hypothetical protein [Luteibacter aegosomatissinici]UPG94338.1 hypothetical protein L2Y97_21395 [Luteibacter aegosomatissinici]
MHARTASLFQRLRSHKGAWLLVFAAIMLKVAAATVCVLDGPKVVALAASQVATAQADVTTHASTATDDEDCLLGEVGGCHCACAHAVTLPATAPFVAAVAIPPALSVHLPASPAPLVSPSPLRPPIA